MIEPEEFYAPSDEPSEAARRRMWARVAANIRPARSPWLMLDRRSFALGMAASVVLLLAGYGAAVAVGRTLDQQRPSAVRVDLAYRAAIREFETLASEGPSTATDAPLAVSRQEVLRSRQDQIRTIDEGIATLQSELRAGDLSPVKRARLRDLYARKLAVLQEMVEQGEITL